jgi:hypothetical protein
LKGAGHERERCILMKESGEVSAPLGKVRYATASVNDMAL